MLFETEQIAQSGHVVPRQPRVKGTDRQKIFAESGSNRHTHIQRICGNFQRIRRPGRRARRIAIVVNEIRKKLIVDIGRVLKVGERRIEGNNNFFE